MILRSLQHSKVFGGELTIGDESNSSTGLVDSLRTTKLPTAVIDTWYDQISFDIKTALGNCRHAVYDDSGGAPTNLLGETASLASYTGFAYKNMTEFQVTTTQLWTSNNCDNAGADYWRQLGSNGDSVSTTSVTFGAFPNPHGGSTAQTPKWTSKIRHS